MIQKLDNIIDNIIFYILSACLVGMLTLSVLGIVLRWFEIAFLWLEPLVRHLVFFSAFLGGALATGKGNHIRIDLVSKILENKYPQVQTWLDRVIDLVCVFACILLANAGYEFTKVEMQYGKEAFLGIHSGVLVSSITLGMGLIALRFLLRFMVSFTKVR
jgi:TRAP-type C4-dicarboxylate transport system permease small subunit